MKFETTPAFDSDYRRLKPEHRTAFRLVVKEKFGPACDAYAADASTPWPSALRVKPVRNAAVVLEMTWSFAGPAGYHLQNSSGSMMAPLPMATVVTTLFRRP